jgi:hypothetical protein
MLSSLLTPLVRLMCPHRTVIHHRDGFVCAACGAHAVLERATR